MKIGLVGPTSQQRSLPFDAQRTINLYPVLDQQGKEVSALYGTPGLEVTGVTPELLPGRGGFAAANGRAFFVVGTGVYEFDRLNNSYLIGTLDTSRGNVTIDENGFQLAICDGVSVYILTYATNVFQKVSDPDLPVSGTITFIDGYFVVNEVGTGKFFISGLYDGLSWDALDFATAESSPDALDRVINAVGQLWLLGDKTTEIWTNTGSNTFPFEKIAGAKMSVGVLAAHTAIEVDNSLFWVGKDNIGSGIVYRAKGFSPQRISTDAIEKLIQAATDPSNMRAYTYQQEGHVFYVITGGGLQTTLVYDISSGQWHERAFLNAQGAYEQHLVLHAIYAFNRHIGISRKDGLIYRMALDIYDDNGSPLSAERIYTHISNENKRLVFRQLEIAMETGVPQVGFDPNADSQIETNPQITLWISRDGARTWSTGYTTSFGKIGEYKHRAVFRRLGTAFNWTFKIRITDPVKRSLIGSYLT